MISATSKCIYFSATTSLMLVGCARFQESGKPQDDVIASVYDVKLTRSEAEKAIGNRYTAADSADVFREYTNTWIREQTLIQKAKDQLSESEKDKSDLIIKFYNDLLIYELQSKLLQERLDTNVSEEEVVTYYEKNLQNFELKENIVRMNFIKFGPEIDDIEKLWSLFKKGDQNDLMGMRRLAELSGGTYFTGDSIWLAFTDILKEIPIETYNQENYLNNNNYIQLVVNGYTYFVHIIEFKVKNNISPLEFERQRIIHTLVNKRKVELLQQIEQEIVEEAYKNKKIKIF